MTAKLVWITPNADDMVAHLARVSNPDAEFGTNSEKLIAYLIKHDHWSPFQMASACVEIETTRDIGRQIIRHRSFNFQEFSQRYAEVEQVEPVLREARLQDTSNRQNSLPLTSTQDKLWWETAQKHIWNEASFMYKRAVDLGIAKEQARALLPEGLTTTKMYMSGTIRDWIHYLRIRTGVETQLEHREVAKAIANILNGVIPITFKSVQSCGFDLGLRTAKGT